MDGLLFFRPGQPGYLTLQRAVAHRYACAFGAHPVPSPDEFMCLADPRADAPGHACVGLCAKGSGKLFSEYYLDDPLCPPGAHRPRWVEIGQMASFAGRGSGAYLMYKVLQYLSQGLADRVVLTGTGRVRRLLEALQVGTRDLGPARRERVRDRDVDWGRYYEHEPRVVAIDLRSDVRWLREPPWTPPPLPHVENVVTKSNAA
ncbi:MAG: thermostable hemolysin [Pseudomonadota bacterium]|nr:thermostable hemolysin [Pseudomonadota bacterium]